MAILMEKVIQLEKVQIFKNLNVEELSHIASITSTKDYEENEILFRQNDPGGTAYIITSGKIELFTEENGHERTLTHLGEGACFGEMSLFDGKPRSASARVTEKSSINSFHKTDLLNVIMTYPDIALGILTVLSERLREANREISEFKRVKNEIKELYNKTLSGQKQVKSKR